MIDDETHLSGENPDRIIFSLDDAEALDVRRSGAKAAWLAEARKAGFPVLPGVVVDASESVPYLAAATRVLGEASSGAARLGLTRSDKPNSIPQLEEATADFSEPMVVRSSSVLEGSGQWSGAFTSYLDLLHGELGTGVLGCWASTFGAHTIERFEAAEIDPSTAPMAVLVQPALDPDFGGTARFISANEIEVVAVKGSPAPLVQGWDPGAAARYHLDEQQASGNAAIELLGTETIEQVVSMLVAMQEAIGVTSCEWGLCDGDLSVFQVMRSELPSVATGPEIPLEFASATAVRLSHIVRRYPGPLGETLVLPWMIGSVADIEAAEVSIEPGSALGSIEALVESLAAEVWNIPKKAALQRANETMRTLRSTDPHPALEILSGTRQPDAERGAHVLGMIDAIADLAVAKGVITRPSLIWHLDVGSISNLLSGISVPPKTRIGFDRWEPFNTAVILSAGQLTNGAAAAPGLAAGRMCRITKPEDLDTFQSRDVIVANRPVPNLAPLLWDASAIITVGGSAAAHLFESARALAIPAICGVRMESILENDLNDNEADFALAVDGHNGVVGALPW